MFKQFTTTSLRKRASGIWSKLGFKGLSKSIINWIKMITNSRYLRSTRDITSGYFFEYRKTKEWTFISYVKSLIKKKYYRVFDPRDPLPFIVSTITFTGRNAFRLFRWMVNRLHPPRVLVRD